MKTPGTVEVPSNDVMRLVEESTVVDIETYHYDKRISLNCIYCVAPMSVVESKYRQNMIGIQFHHVDSDLDLSKPRRENMLMTYSLICSYCGHVARFSINAYLNWAKENGVGRKLS